MSIILASSEKCTGCQACANKCVTGAISMKIALEGFVYPIIDNQKCVECHACEYVCPELSSTSIAHSMLSDSYMAKANDENVRFNSSSGGIFPLIAKSVINQGGIVFGAAFENDFKSVKHIAITNLEQLYKIQGSKYLQSDIGNAYAQAKRYLKAGRIVLFSGTGCQIAGLKKYLGQDYRSLITVDVVCHGVPAQSLWENYLDLLEKKYSSKARYVNFRSKRVGWEEFGIESKFSEKYYFKELKDDPYLEIFQRNLSLRRSCYNCSYKSINGISDISVGDLWGINQINPDFNDNKGISFIMIHSEKGRDVFDEISSEIVFKEVDTKQAILYNKNISCSSRMPDSRASFFDDLNKLAFDKVIKKYSVPSIKTRVKNACKVIGIYELLMKIKKNRGGYDKNLEYGLVIVFKESILT